MHTPIVRPFHRLRRFTSLSVGAAIATTGCIQGVQSFSTTTPQPTESAYACALREVNQLGYTVTNTNRDAGFIAADKDVTSKAARLLSNNEYVDHLTVSIFSDSANATRTIRTTVSRTARASNVFGNSTSTVKTSAQSKDDASALLAACGRGSAMSSQR